MGGRAAAVAPGGSSPGALARSAQGSPFSLLLLASPSLPHPCAFLHGCWNPSCACLGVSENHSETERQGEASGRLCGPCSAGRGRGPMTSPPAASWLCPAGAPAMVSSQVGLPGRRQKPVGGDAQPRGWQAAAPTSLAWARSELPRSDPPRTRCEAQLEHNHAPGM